MQDVKMQELKMQDTKIEGMKQLFRRTWSAFTGC